MAIFPPLDLAARAMLANQLALQTATNNIANVDTPGYSRQAVDLGEVPPSNQAGALVGAGVRVTGIRQEVDEFVEAQLLEARGRSAHREAAREALARLESVVPDLEESGLVALIDRFFAAAGAVADRPQGLVEREVLLGAARGVAGEFRRQRADLGDLQRGLDDQVRAAAGEINDRLDAIAQLNQQIVLLEVGGGAANALRDERRRLVGEIGERLAVYEVKADAFTLATAGGVVLLTGTHVQHLAVRDDPGSLGLDGAPLAELGLEGSGGTFLSVGAESFSGGRIEGLREVRDGAVVDAATALDQAATTLSTAVNSVQTDPDGRDLTGAVGSPLFSATSAADMSVVLSDAAGIAAGTASAPLGNENALALAAVGQSSFAALDDTTLRGFLARRAATVGAARRDAEDMASVEAAVLNQVQTRREAVSGVSLDEEFLAVTRFQRAFEAAAAVIRTSDRMLEELLALVR